MNYPYVRAAPSPQQTLDLFAGHWASRLPPPFAELTAGQAALFQDPKMTWADEKLAALGRPIRGAAVLELGPLEGGHTYMLSRLGARAVTAVEAHKEAYLKCLVVKETLGIERVNFLLGDAVEFLKQHPHRYDIGVASGILYHMANPVELIGLLCDRADAVVLWTVFWDPKYSRQHPGQPAGSGAVTRSEHRGFAHSLHLHDYGAGFDYGTFWGGPASHAQWMEKDEILGAFRHFGFGHQLFEVQANPNGSALLLAARRGPA